MRKTEKKAIGYDKDGSPKKIMVKTHVCTRCGLEEIA